MSVVIEEREDGWEFTSGPIRLGFRWVQDRWTHAIELATLADGWSPIVRAHEADPSNPASSLPVSPSYQQLHTQEDGQGRLHVLLVGQSGPHHYSAVFTLAGEDEDAETSVTVDLADRCRGSTTRLAATYLVELPSGDLRDASPSRILWEPGLTQSGQLSFLALEPGRVALAEAGRRATRVQALAPGDPAGPTQRLVYRWSWTP